MGQVRRKPKGSWKEEAGKLDRVQWIMTLGTVDLDRRVVRYSGGLEWRGGLKTHL